MSLNDDSVTAGIRVSSNHPDRYQAPIAPTQSEFFHDVTTSYPVDRLVQPSRACEDTYIHDDRSRT